MKKRGGIRTNKPLSLKSGDVVVLKLEYSNTTNISAPGLLLYQSVNSGWVEEAVFNIPSSVSQDENGFTAQFLISDSFTGYAEIHPLVQTDESTSVVFKSLSVRSTDSGLINSKGDYVKNTRENLPDDNVYGVGVKQIVKLNADEYQALEHKRADTLYIVADGESVALHSGKGYYLSGLHAQEISPFENINAVSISDCEI